MVLYFPSTVAAGLLVRPLHPSAATTLPPGPPQRPSGVSSEIVLDDQTRYPYTSTTDTRDTFGLTGEGPVGLSSFVGVC